MKAAHLVERVGEDMGVRHIWWRVEEVMGKLSMESGEEKVLTPMCLPLGAYIYVRERWWVW